MNKQVFTISCLLLFSVWLGGCEDLLRETGEPIHVNLTINVLVLDNLESPRPDTKVNFRSVKATVKDIGADEQLDTVTTLSKFTDLNGKTSFIVGYNLHDNPKERIDVTVSTAASSVDLTIITYDDATAQSGDTNIAAISRSVTLTHNP